MSGNRTLAIIREAVGEHFGVPVEAISARGRSAHIVRPRFAAIYLARKLTSLSLAEIGRAFGGRDHSTTYHALQAIMAQAQSDPDLLADLEEIARRVDLNAPGRVAASMDRLADVIAGKLLARVSGTLALDPLAEIDPELLAAVRAVASTAERFGQERYGRDERRAAEALHNAADELRAVFRRREPLPRKGGVRGC